MKVKYPQIKVMLTGGNGNAFVILGKVGKAMREAGLTSEQIKEFQTEATIGDYDNMLQTCMKYVDVL